MSIIVSILPKKPLLTFSGGIILLSVIPLIIGLTFPNGGGNILSFMNRPETGWIDPARSDTSSVCLQGMAESNGFLSNRPVIWGLVINELDQFSPTHLVGYGFRGQVVSGLYEKYSCLFTSQTNNLIQSSHNIWLQTVLDTGYLGLLLLIILFAFCLIRLVRIFDQHERVSRGFLAALMVIILNGSLESSLTLDFDGVFYWILVIAIGIIFLSPSVIKSKLKHTADQIEDQ